MRIAIVQSKADPANGRIATARVEELVAQYSRPDDFWILPEVFDTGWNVSDGRDRIDGAACHGFLRSVSEKYGIAICGSYYARTDDGKYRNTFNVVKADISLDATCGKRHLFGDFEKGEVLPGDSLLTFGIDGMVFRAVVCYDLRFPVWCRNFRTNPYDALICVSQWPLSRKADRKLLLAARAMENVAYSINGNGLGESAVYLPDGQLGFEMGTDDEVGFFDIDASVVSDIRKRKRYLQDSDDYNIEI